MTDTSARNLLRMMVLGTIVIGAAVGYAIYTTPPTVDKAVVVEKTVEPVTPEHKCIEIKDWKMIVTLHAGTVSFTELTHTQSVAAEVAYYAMPPASSRPADLVPTDVVVIAGQGIDFEGLAGTFASNGCGLLNLKLNAKLKKAMLDAAGVK